MTTARAERQFVWKFIRPQFADVTVATFCNLLLALVTALVPICIGPGLGIITAAPTDVVQTKDLMDTRLLALFLWLGGESHYLVQDLLQLIPAAIVILASLRGVLSILQWLLWERAGERIARNVREELGTRFLTFPPALRSRTTAKGSAALSAVASTDVKVMRDFIVHYYGGIPREILQITFIAATLCLLSPKLFAIFTLGIIPAGIVIRHLGKKIRGRSSKALNDYSQLTEWLQQRLLGVETIKQFGTEELESQKMRELSQNIFERFFRAARVKARTSPIMELFAIGSLVLVLMMALAEIHSGSTTGQVQLSFFTGLAILAQSAGKLGRYINASKEGGAAVARTLAAWQSLEPQSVAGARTFVAEGQRAQIICRGITHRYAGAKTDALTDISLDLDGGQIHCVCGASGAGKSTLLRVLLGVLQPQAGEIVFRAHANRRILYIPQNIQLAPDSIAGNVAYPERIVDRDRVTTALARVGFTVPENLDDGMDTIVGTGGRELSGGQAQRVLLARLFYHPGDFIFIDEGTSALDPETEAITHKALRALADRGAVVVMIAHRPATLKLADAIVRLERGCLA